MDCIKNNCSKLCFVLSGGCGDPSIGSRVIATVSGTAVGDTVTSTCPSWHRLSGNRTITCQANGRWSDNVACSKYRMTFMYRAHAHICISTVIAYSVGRCLHFSVNPLQGIICHVMYDDSGKAAPCPHGFLHFHR